jgi:hypothetical protein
MQCDVLAQHDSVDGETSARIWDGVNQTFGVIAAIPRTDLAYIGAVRRIYASAGSGEESMWWMPLLNMLSGFVLEVLNLLPETESTRMIAMNVGAMTAPELLNDYYKQKVPIPEDAERLKTYADAMVDHVNYATALVERPVAGLVAEVSSEFKNMLQQSVEKGERRLDQNS